MLLPYQLKTFQGARYSLFAYNADGVKGGYALFDDFTVDEPMADRSGNLPLGKVITLVNRGNGFPAWANPHGMLHFCGPWQKDEYMKDGCRFRVHDRGQGKVALEAMNGTGFLTVVGAGLSADVRLMKEGHKKTYIVQYLSDEYDISTRNVYRVIDKFSGNIHFSGAD